MSAPTPLPGARALFTLDPAVDHLNHGSFGSPPLVVQQAQRALREEMEADPVRFMTRGLHERVAGARTELAGFVGADPDTTALVGNTTAGVSVVLHTLGLRPGDEVLTTDHGYGAVDLAIAGHGGRVAKVPVDLDAGDDDVVTALLAALTPATRLVVLDLITSPTARLFPVAKAAVALRDAGVPLLVDGAHGPGAVELDVAGIGADFFVGNVHKWAYAPRGTALLSVASSWVPRIRALLVSWAQPQGFPLAVEFVGTADYTGWLAAPTGPRFLTDLGADRVRTHNDQLAAYGQGAIADALGVAEPPQPGGALPMRILPLPAGLPIGGYQLRDLIADRLGTVVAVNPWRDRLWLRVCAQVYNSADQYDRLAAALPALLAELR